MVRIHLDLSLRQRNNPLSSIANKLIRGYKTQEINSSNQFQCEISAALHRIGWNHTFDFSTPKESISIDLAHVESMCAIEVDTRAQYLFRGKQRHTLHGARQFKSRILSALGWKVIHIPYYEWSALHQNPNDEEAYLRKKLNKDPLLSSSSKSISSSSDIHG